MTDWQINEPGGKFRPTHDDDGEMVAAVVQEGEHGIRRVTCPECGEVMLTDRGDAGQAVEPDE